MSSLLSETVLVTTAGLVSLPLVSRRFRRALRPNEHVRFNTTTMVAGLALTWMILDTPGEHAGHLLRSVVRIEGAILVSVIAITALLVGAAS